MKELDKKSEVIDEVGDLMLSRVYNRLCYILIK